METPNQLPTAADTACELAKVEAEPLLPVEKWLIGGSLALGLALLGLLLWVGKTYFAVGAMSRATSPREAGQHEVRQRRQNCPARDRADPGEQNVTHLPPMYSSGHRAHPEQ